MEGQNGLRTKHRGFDEGEAAWFLLFDPDQYDDDGAHELNGAPRHLEELQGEIARQPRGLTWAGVGTFALIGVSILAIAAWVML